MAAGHVSASDALLCHFTVEAFRKRLPTVVVTRADRLKEHGPVSESGMKQQSLVA